MIKLPILALKEVKDKNKGSTYEIYFQARKRKHLFITIYEMSNWNQHQKHILNNKGHEKKSERSS